MNKNVDNKINIVTISSEQMTDHDSELTDFNQNRPYKSDICC